MKATLYNSVKGTLLAVVNVLIFIAFIAAIIMHLWPVVVVLGLVNCLFLWFWFDTYYLIKDDQLFYKCAFISGSVPISAIHEIVHHNRGVVMTNLKPALALTGLIIKYNRWDDMFVSPENAGQFIAELQAINPDIKVTG